MIIIIIIIIRMVPLPVPPAIMPSWETFLSTSGDFLSGRMANEPERQTRTEEREGGGGHYLWVIIYYYSVLCLMLGADFTKAHSLCATTKANKADSECEWSGAVRVRWRLAQGHLDTWLRRERGASNQQPSALSS